MEFCGMKREIDRKCLNRARVHANAQSFDRCEMATSNRRNMTKNQPRDTKGAEDMTFRSHP